MLKGINLGLQMIADWFSLMYKAQANGNQECIAALMGVASTWVGEATGAKLGVDANIKIGLGNLLFGDPFAGSRAEFRNVKARFPKG